MDSEELVVWFFSGIFVGSFISPLLATFILVTFIILRNKPLPDICGGHRPQIIINHFLSRLLPETWKRMAKELTPSVNIAPPPTIAPPPATTTTTFPSFQPPNLYSFNTPTFGK